jgi:hypothetical protein
MLWVATNDIQDAFAPDELAVRAALFDRCRNFHKQFSFNTGWLVCFPDSASRSFHYTNFNPFRPDSVSPV